MHRITNHLSPFERFLYTSSSGIETSSGTNNGVIIFLALGFTGLALLTCAVFVFIQHRATAKHTTEQQQRQEEDMEAPGVGREETITVKRRISSYLTWFPTGSATLALALSLVSHASCKFVSTYEDPDFLAIGLWSVSYIYHENSSCEEFPDDFHLDYAFRCARVSAILASCLGGICMLALWYFSVAYYWLQPPESTPQPLSNKTSAMGLLLLLLLGMTLVAQSLTLFLLRTERCSAISTTCEIENGALYTILAQLYWFLAFVGVVLLPSATFNQYEHGVAMKH